MGSWAGPPSASELVLNKVKEDKLTKILPETGRQNLKGASKRPLSKFWLPEPGDVRTKLKINIPYNPLILQAKLKPPVPARRPTVNIIHKAGAFPKLLEQRVVNSKAELAQRECLTRARVTQILNLLKLAPDIREYLSSLTDENLIGFFTERRLRKITLIRDHKMQMKKFQELKG